MPFWPNVHANDFDEFLKDLILCKILSKQKNLQISTLCCNLLSSPVWQNESQIAFSDSIIIVWTSPSVIWVQESLRFRFGALYSYYRGGKNYVKTEKISRFFCFKLTCADWRRKLRKRIRSSVFDSLLKPLAIKISSVVDCLRIWLMGVPKIKDRKITEFPHCEENCSKISLFGECSWELWALEVESGLG